MFHRKESERNLLLDRHHLRDSDGRIIVDMTVNDDTNFLSVYSENPSPVICTEAAAFIENCTAAIPPHEQLTLRIHSDCIDDLEKEIYRRAISEYYRKQYSANEIERKRNNLIVFLLTAAGVLTLLAEVFLLEFTDYQIWAEMIDIVAWVLLWEAVDISIFRNKALRMKRKRYFSYISMKIEYIPLRRDRV